MSLYNKKLASELRELLGDEFKVQSWIINYEHDVLTISKGGKIIEIFTKHIKRVTNPKTLNIEYVEQ